MISALEAEKLAILQELPAGTSFRRTYDGKRLTLAVKRKASEFTSDDEMRVWLSSTLNSFVNALRPRLKAISHQKRQQQL
jgi:hypothetical protein